MTMSRLLIPKINEGKTNAVWPIDKTVKLRITTIFTNICKNEDEHVYTYCTLYYTTPRCMLYNTVIYMFCNILNIYSSFIIFDVL